MLMHLMFWAFVGHLFGDYLFQSKKVALGKSKPGWSGVWYCIFHCLLYSSWVMLFVFIGVPSTRHPSATLIFSMVYATHYPIDRMSLGDLWLLLIHGRRPFDPWPKGATLSTEVWQERITQKAFDVLVYVIVDNALHLFLMLAGFAAMLEVGLL